MGYRKERGRKMGKEEGEEPGGGKEKGNAI